MSGREAVRGFQNLGWEVARQSGSHIIMVRHGHDASLSVPNHPTLALGTLRSLIRAADITVDEFVEALN